MSSARIPHPPNPVSGTALPLLSLQLKQKMLRVLQGGSSKQAVKEILQVGHPFSTIPGTITLMSRNNAPSSLAIDSTRPLNNNATMSEQANNGTISQSSNPGGTKRTMSELSGYKDLSKAPLALGDDTVETKPTTSTFSTATVSRFQDLPTPHYDDLNETVDTEFSGNVKTLIRLVSELPDGVTKQTGAQIIRLTMEAMGISMEDVLSEAQGAQSEMLDAVRANIKKIEEYKTVIRKLETDIKYYQGKANELSEIIDLFILSNTSSAKMPSLDSASDY